MKYFEVTGETRRKVLDILDQRLKAHETARAFADQHGAKEYGYNGLLRERVTALVFADGVTPNPKVLRRQFDRSSRSYSNFYVPNRSTKEGKAIAKVMEAIVLPGGNEIADAAGIEMWSGFGVCTPGVRVWGPRKRVILICSDKVTTKNKDCKRLADTAFEKLQAKYGDTDDAEDDDTEA